MVAAIGTTATAISVGMVIGYSAILLPELQKPNSRFRVDVQVSSWIGTTIIIETRNSSVIENCFPF